MVTEDARAANAVHAQEVRARWALQLGALVCLIILILIIFWSDIAAAVEVWWVYPTYSHCFLVIPISAWLMWEERERLRAEVPELTPKALWAIPPLVILWLVSEYATITEGRQFAILGLVQIATLIMLGMRIYRIILFPALFLFFLVPTGQYLIPPLQHFTTYFVDNSLTLIGIPHFTEGTMIELTNGQFEIAEACAGLRFLIATLALGTIFAHLTYRSWKKTILFLTACVIVPIIGNGLRVLGIILLAHATNNEIAVGADHLVYGWGFAVAIMLVLILVGSRFADPPANEVVFAPTSAVPFSRIAVITVALTTALAITVGPALAWWRESGPRAFNTLEITRPLKAEGWLIVPSNGTWHPAYNKPDAELAVSMVQVNMPSATPVDVVVEYFARVRDQHKLIASTNSLWDVYHWHAVELHRLSARLGSVPIDLTEAIISSGSDRRLVWWSYWMDGHFTDSALMVKLLQLETTLDGNDGAAVIAISTPVSDLPDVARERLREALTALEDIPARLNEGARVSKGESRH